MTNNHVKQTIGLTAAVALALAILSGGASAQQAGQQTPVANTSYLRDTNGNVPLSSDGLCWHTGYVPMAQTWTAGCDAKLVPASVVLTPEPAPIVAAAAAPVAVVVAKKLTFDADALFDFDKSSLRPAGRATLNDFADRIKGINPETIRTVGHTDRIGSSSYNQVLSEERAESVKAYLVSVGIASNRVQTEGRGETQPVTLAGDCLSGSAKVIACLQPDRRVDIELIGAKIE